MNFVNNQDVNNNQFIPNNNFINNLNDNEILNNANLINNNNNINNNIIVNQNNNINNRIQNFHIRTNDIIDGSLMLQDFIDAHRDDDFEINNTNEIINWFHNLQSPMNNVENGMYCWRILDICLFNVGHDRHDIIWNDELRHFIDNLYNIYEHRANHG